MGGGAGSVAGAAGAGGVGAGVAAVAAAGVGSGMSTVSADAAGGAAGGELEPEPPPQETAHMTIGKR